MESPLKSANIEQKLPGRIPANLSVMDKSDKLVQNDFLVLTETEQDIGELPCF